jgi:class 3 adenylate cyclase
LNAEFFGTPQTRHVEVKTVEGETVHYEATSVVSGERIVIGLENVTQTVRYNTLIAEEREKSDGILQQILPPSLVKQVQAGETDISFAVQSASVSFFDVVSFTPWCGSHAASYVMSTLNGLYKMCDEEVAKRATMTKMKCIGDCYMSAAGLFMEVNQPAVHSKEMVGFGLAALDCVTRINKLKNEALQIRVGVNTGGPIAAGVLGIGKPTFEIIGPAIVLAQQMEHHGVPGMVHCPRAVYELIYGDQFIIKEKGETETKQGKMITYVVSGFKKK